MDSSIHEQEPAPSWGHSGGPSREALPHQGGGALEVGGETRLPLAWPGTQTRETPGDPGSC